MECNSKQPSRCAACWFSLFKLLVSAVDLCAGSVTNPGKNLDRATKYVGGATPRVPQRIFNTGISIKECIIANRGWSLFESKFVQTLLIIERCTCGTWTRRRKGKRDIRLRLASPDRLSPPQIPFLLIKI